MNTIKTLPLEMGGIALNAIEIAHLISELIGDYLNENIGTFPKRILISEYVYKMLLNDTEVMHRKMHDIRMSEQHKEQFMGVPIYSCTNVENDFIEISGDIK